MLTYTSYPVPSLLCQLVIHQIISERTGLNLWLVLLVSV